MTGKIWVAVASMAAFVAPVAAQAANVPISFWGPNGVSAILTFSVDSNPNTGVLPGTAPNPVDPIGSYVISGVSGTFSDAAAGISNAAVTGVVPANHATPEPTNLLAPYSFSLLPVANGVDEGNGIISPGLHYDNLFYPGGSPQTASDYPFSGGLLDIYGVVFTLANGDFVNFWSNGVTPGGLSYGAAVTDGTDVLDYTGDVQLGTPEPAAWAMMIVGFGLAGAAMRRKRKVGAAVRFA